MQRGDAVSHHYDVALGRTLLPFRWHVRRRTLLDCSWPRVTEASRSKTPGGMGDYCMLFLFWELLVYVLCLFSHQDHMVNYSFGNLIYIWISYELTQIRPMDPMICECLGCVSESQWPHYLWGSGQVAKQCNAFVSPLTFYHFHLLTAHHIAFFLFLSLSPSLHITFLLAFWSSVYIFSSY